MHRCHSIHSFKSVKAQLKTASDPETCYTCHKTQRAQSNRQSHHPVKEGKSLRFLPQPARWFAAEDAAGGVDERALLQVPRGEARTVPVRACAGAGGLHVLPRAAWVESQEAPRAEASQPCWNCHLTGSGHFGSGDNFSTENGARVAPPGAPGYPTVNNRFTEKACKNCHANLHGSNSPSGAFFLR